MKPAKKHRDGRMGYNLIYNHYQGLSNINHMSASTEKKLAQCTYTDKKINWTLEKYATLNKDQHKILESLE